MARLEKTGKIVVGTYEIDVRYKRMKSIYLKLKPDGRLEISAPTTTSKKYLIEFVQSRIPWIEEKQQKIIELQKSAIQLKEDEILLFGQPHSGSLSKEELQDLLHEKITHYYEKYWEFFAEQGCKPIEIKYRVMRTTWGICRPTAGIITFSKRLVHQPIEFIEYVVLHEMCHLLIPNHGRDFYDLVKQHMPQFRQYEKARILYETEAVRS